MSMITIRPDQRAYLERLSREASKRVGRRVSITEAMQEILDMCIRDEMVYEARTADPVQPDRRELYKAATDRRTTALTIEALLDRIT
jgi:hypothetical protein